MTWRRRPSTSPVPSVTLHPPLPHQASKAAAALDLSHALGRIVARCKRRWRNRAVAALVHGAAMMRAAVPYTMLERHHPWPLPLP
jgi:hypothetical protein